MTARLFFEEPSAPAKMTWALRSARKNNNGSRSTPIVWGKCKASAAHVLASKLHLDCILYTVAR